MNKIFEYFDRNYVFNYQIEVTKVFGLQVYKI